MQEADAARKRLMRASSCVSANADAHALPFMIMQRVCGDVDGPRRVRNRYKRWEAFSGSPGSFGLFDSDRLRGKSSRRSR